MSLYWLCRRAGGGEEGALAEGREFGPAGHLAFHHLDVAAGASAPGAGVRDV
ncbi:hypothetical protein [Streptomyces sp. NBC_01579]|uniref:hypothetical protein n=1 Tax=Streptomyces sp. NBC_01579 TaxID=2975885 RepID=UPI00386F1A6E